jgi:hypothetical protein
MKKSELKKLIREELEERVSLPPRSDTSKEMEVLIAGFRSAIVKGNSGNIWKYYKLLEPLVKAYIEEIDGEKYTTWSKFITPGSTNL